MRVLLPNHPCRPPAMIGHLLTAAAANQNVIGAFAMLPCLEESATQDVSCACPGSAARAVPSLSAWKLNEPD